MNSAGMKTKQQVLSERDNKRVRAAEGKEGCHV